jgi:PPP family 3-phenylpropionic acid transporter
MRSKLGPALSGTLFYTGFWAAEGVYSPFFMVYVYHLGVSTSQVGLLGMLFPLMTLIFSPLFSALADRYAWRVRILSLALGLYSLALFLFILPKTFWLLIPAVAILGFFRSPILPIADSLIVRMCTRYQLSFGSLRLWGSLSFAVVAILCGWLWANIGYTWMFILGGAIYLAFILLVQHLEEGPVQEQVSRAKPSMVTLWKDPGLVVILTGTFLTGVGLYLSSLYGGLYVEHLGGTELMVGMFFGVSALFEMPTMQAFEKLRRRLGPSGTLLTAYAMAELSLLGFVVAQNAWMLLVAGMVRGLAIGLFYTANVRLIDERVPQELSSTAQAVLNAGALGMVPLIVSPLGGWVFEAFGPEWVFAGGAISIGLAMLVIVFARLRKIL